jgi:hypothetical protein
MWQLVIGAKNIIDREKMANVRKIDYAPEVAIERLHRTGVKTQTLTHRHQLGMVVHRMTQCPPIRATTLR